MPVSPIEAHPGLAAGDVQSLRNLPLSVATSLCILHVLYIHVMHLMEDLLSLSLSSLLFLEDLKPSGEVSILVVWNSSFHKTSSVAHVVCQT